MCPELPSSIDMRTVAKSATHISFQAAALVVRRVFVRWVVRPKSLGIDLGCEQQQQQTPIAAARSCLLVSRIMAHSYGVEAHPNLGLLLTGGCAAQEKAPVLFIPAWLWLVRFFLRIGSPTLYILALLFGIGVLVAVACLVQQDAELTATRVALHSRDLALGSTMQPLVAGMSPFCNVIHIFSSWMCVEMCLT
jgi:hypothetical protein